MNFNSASVFSVTYRAGTRVADAPRELGFFVGTVKLAGAIHSESLCDL